MSRIHYKSYNGITSLARDLRKNQTTEEKILWEEIKERRIGGYKFLRQHPVFYRIDKGWIEFYIADFYCNKLKLIIELDGRIHDNRKEYDKERDEKLAAKGFLVIRIENEKISDIPNLLIYLERKITERALDLAIT